MVENKGFTIILVSNDVFSGNKVEKHTNHWRSNLLMFQEYEAQKLLVQMVQMVQMRS